MSRSRRTGDCARSRSVRRCTGTARTARASGSKPESTMRSELVLSAALAACEYTDLAQPIAIHTSELSADDAADLAEAATCWNLRFGTHFEIDSDAPQIVEAFYDDATCLSAVAQVQAGTPA